MKNNRTLIFSSVMSELLESFSPFIDDFLKSFHAQYTLKNPSNNNFIPKDTDSATIDETFFEDLFKHIPRSIPLYKEIIVKLCALASSDVNGTIHFLTKLIKEAINGRPTKQFTLLQMVKTFPDLNDKVNYLLFFYLSNIFIADLICQIMANYYAKKSIKPPTSANNSTFDSDNNNEISPDIVTYLTRTAYSIAIAKHELPNATIRVLSQWSVILSILSEYEFNSVTQIFSMFLNSNDITNALVLMQYIRFDMHDAFGSVFFESIIQQVRLHIRKKTITNAGLEAVSKMIVTIPFNEELFTKLYQTVRPLRKDKNMKNLWPGSVILSCSLFLRLPGKRNRSKFLQKQVLGSCNDIKKLETSLKCFAMVIVGRNTDVFWENWEWGKNPRASKYTYLHLNSACEMLQDDPRSFTTIFMSNYFVKSEFYLYPKIVKHILLHLASLDFSYFTSFVVKQFLELDDDDPRFALLLKIVPKVNQSDFWDHAFKKPNNISEQISKFNKLLRQKVLSALKLCLENLEISCKKSNSNSNLSSSECENEYGTGHSICFFEKDIMIESLLSEADQKISSILDEWKVNNNFTPNRIRLKFAQFPKDKYSLIDSLFPTLKLILDENDFNNTTMMDIFIGCSYINDSIVAQTSYDISRNIIPRLSNSESFLQMLIVAISTNEDYESVYTCLSILESALYASCNNNDNDKKIENDVNACFCLDESLSTDSGTERDSYSEKDCSNKCTISKKLLIDIEVIAFLSLSSEHPSIRRLALAVLKTVNDIFGGFGLLSYLKSNFKRIEKDAKEHILIQSRFVNYDNKISQKNELMNPWRSYSTTRISFKTAILSYYYDVWVFFVSAMINILIEVNYLPFFKHIKNIIPSFTPILFDCRSIRKGDIAAIIIILSSMFYTKAITSSERYQSSKACIKKHGKSKEKHAKIIMKNTENTEILYYSQQFAPYSDSTDERATICAYLTKLLSDEFDETYSEIGFELIPHLHFSVLGPVIEVLSNVPQKKLPKAAQTLSLILRLSEIDSYFITHNFRRITSFINTINTYLLENQLNTPRLMEWTKNQIKPILNNILLAFDYCTIISTTFRACKLLKDNSWPLTTREIVFRFLVNWAITAYNTSDTEINQIYNSNNNNQLSRTQSLKSTEIETKEMNKWWRTVTSKLDASLVLKNLREYAKVAIAALSKVGPMFTHSPLFDEIAVHFLGSIEMSGMPILTSILNFHFDIIFDDYVKACYTQPVSISSAFFDAIVNNIKSEHGDSIVNKSGQILLLAMVYGQREHTRAHEMIDRFLSIAVEHDLLILPKDIKDSKDSKNIINDIVSGIFNTISSVTNFSFLLTKKDKNDENDSSRCFDPIKSEIYDSAYFKLVPQIFTYAAEAVFKAFFTVIEEYKVMSIPFKDVTNAARVWTSVIRFLPKQNTCVQVFVPPQFNYFTPYQFLTTLAHITESIDEDRGKILLSLWEDLAKAPDHRQIIPIYLSNMVNSKSMQGIFLKLLDFFPDEVLPFIDERCSFAYFFHCTKCLKEDFTLSSSKWSAFFLCHVFDHNFDKILPKLPTILQFVIIFRERGLDQPFRSICRKLCVECPDGIVTNAQLRIVVGQLVKTLSSSSYEKFSIESWGNECLKWLFACDDMHLASTSFLIYNLINKPYDASILHFQIIHTVSYHIGKVAEIQEKQIQQNSHIKKNTGRQEEESSTTSTTQLHSTSSSQFNLSSLKSDLALLIDESFIFYSKHLEGNDILVYNYISSFLDSQILPHLELIGAIRFFIQAFHQPDILLLVCQNMITLVRPLIPMIEEDRNVQELIDKCVEKIDNEDVKMIAAPIKRAHPNLFPHLLPYEKLITKVSVNAMCNALVHYAVLAESSSRPVLDFIFDISTTILKKVSDENNKNPLTRLYQAALRSLNTCPSAFAFVQEVCELMPQVASNELVESFVWTRSLDDVNRSIKLVLSKMKCGSFSNLQQSPRGSKSMQQIAPQLPPSSNSAPVPQISSPSQQNQTNSKASETLKNIDESESLVAIELSSDNNYSDTSSREIESEINIASHLCNYTTSPTSLTQPMSSVQGFGTKLTDCHSYKSVLNFLFLTEEEEEIENESNISLVDASSGGSVPLLSIHSSDDNKNKKNDLKSSALPRILPFAAQKEMVEGMKKIKTKMEKKRVHQNLLLSSQTSSSLNEDRDDSLLAIPNSTSIVFNSFQHGPQSGRRKSRVGRSKSGKSDTEKIDSGSDDTDLSGSGESDTENENDVVDKNDDDDDEEEEDEGQNFVCQPNFATVYGSLIQFPSFANGAENGTGESILNGFSPLKHPKKLITSLPQSGGQQNDTDNSPLFDRNVLEEEIERKRMSALANNLTPNEFFRDGFARRRSSSNISNS